MYNLNFKFFRQRRRYIY